ncbi:MAG: alpha/beta hydrolase [Pseudomonadota bacterium]
MPRILHAAAFVLAILAGNAVAVGAYPPQLPGAVPLVYETYGAVAMRLWVFNPEGHNLSEQRPAVVLFFGGGWNRGSPEQFERHARYLASRGIVAAVADYRVGSRHESSPMDSMTDGCAAVRYLRANALRLGIDPQRIGAGGGSAGGQIAASIATADLFRRDGEVSCVPDALVLFNPVYDNGPTGYGHGRVKRYWEQISPLHNIHAPMPPSVTLLGSDDKLIPVATAREWQRRVEAAGGRADVHIYDGARHGFFNKTAYYAETVATMDRFLASLGWLEGEPTVAKPSDSAEGRGKRERTTRVD